MKLLLAEAPKYGFEVLYKLESFRHAISNHQISSIVKEILSRSIGTPLFNKRIKEIRNSRVIVVHPQSLGYNLLFDLVNNNNQVSIYTVDNDFFCIKSYNHLDGTFEPCLKCIGGSFENAERFKCKPYPLNLTQPLSVQRKKKIEYLSILKNLSEKITFLSQSSNQSDLLFKHFGLKIKVKEIGLLTNDVPIDIQSMLQNKFLSEEGESYDIVYHGAPNEAKGYFFALRVFRELRDLRILVPTQMVYAKRLFKKYGYDFEDLRHISFKPMSWETGLKDVVIRSRLILCPSLWSACIEGALVKSIMFNGSVAVVDSTNSFSNTLPKGVVFRLPKNPEEAVQKLRSIIGSHEIIERTREISKNWLLAFLKYNKGFVERFFGDEKINY